MRDLKDLFIDVKNNYGKSQFKGNKTADALRNSPKNIIPRSHFDRDRYMIKGSAGQSQWAGIPWIMITDQNISKTAQVGLYIVYLFDSSQDNVYLCLETGWQFFEDRYKTTTEALEKIKQFAQYIRLNIYSFDNHSRFSETIPDLDPRKILRSSNKVDGYAAGTIVSKKYEINNQLSNNELLMDLVELKVIYQEIINHFKLFSLEKYKNFVKHVLEQRVTEYERIKKDKKQINDTPFEIALRLKENSTPSTDSSVKNYTSEIKKINSKELIKEANYNLAFDYLAKKIAAEYEKIRLIKLGYSKENILIEESSNNKKGEVGYDLKSTAVDKSGHKVIRYITVKISENDMKFPFHMTSNELNKRKKLGNKYYIYRLCRLSENPKVQIISSDKKIELERQLNFYVV